LLLKTKRSESGAVGRQFFRTCANLRIQWHVPRLSGFCAFAADGKNVPREIDVAPLQLQQLASPKAGVQRDEYQGCEIVRVAPVVGPGLVSPLASAAR
jgi:hypothetical protein